MMQNDLFGERKAHFDGATYDPEKDFRRLDSQLGRVYRLMRDGKWRTLREIAMLVNGSEAGVSARLRDLRKPKFGGYTLQSKRRFDSLWIYRLEDTNG